MPLFAMPQVFPYFLGVLQQALSMRGERDGVSRPMRAFKTRLAPDGERDAVNAHNTFDVCKGHRRMVSGIVMLT